MSLDSFLQIFLYQTILRNKLTIWVKRREIYIDKCLLQNTFNISIVQLQGSTLFHSGFILASKSSKKINFEWDGLSAYQFSYSIQEGSFFPFFIYIKNKLKELHYELEFWVYFSSSSSFSFWRYLFMFIYYYNLQKTKILLYLSQ